MTDHEAAELTALVHELWPSKFYWTPAMSGLWAEKLAHARHWTARQCEAVIRDERASHDGRTPGMAKILQRCHQAHRTGGPVANANQHQPIDDAAWAEIHRDRAAAAAWWHEVREAGEAPEVVRLATLAYPMWAAKWQRFLKAEYRPKPIACMALLAAWQEFHDTGARPKPVYEPGFMAGAVGV